MAEWWYNTNYHSTLTMIPFEALYGYKPPMFSFTELGPSSTEVRSFTKDRSKLQSILKEALTQAQAMMKFYADKKRIEKGF